MDEYGGTPAPTRIQSRSLPDETHPQKESKHDESNIRCPAVVRLALAHIAPGGAIHRTQTGPNSATVIGPYHSPTKQRTPPTPTSQRKNPSEATT